MLNTTQFFVSLSGANHPIENEEERTSRVAGARVAETETELSPEAYYHITFLRTSVELLAPTHQGEGRAGGTSLTLVPAKQPSRTTHIKKTRSGSSRRATPCRVNFPTTPPVPRQQKPSQIAPTSEIRRSERPDPPHPTRRPRNRGKSVDGRIVNVSASSARRGGDSPESSSQASSLGPLKSRTSNHQSEITVRPRAQECIRQEGTDRLAPRALIEHTGESSKLRETTGGVGSIRRFRKHSGGTPFPILGRGLLNSRNRLFERYRRTEDRQ